MTIETELFWLYFLCDWWVRLGLYLFFFTQRQFRRLSAPGAHCVTKTMSALLLLQQLLLSSLDFCSPSHLNLLKRRGSWKRATQTHKLLEAKMIISKNPYQSGQSYTCVATQRNVFRLVIWRHISV